MTASTDAALAAVVGVVGDIHDGTLTASSNDVETLVHALDILATLGDDNNDR